MQASRSRGTCRALSRVSVWAHRQAGLLSVWTSARWAQSTCFIVFPWIMAIMHIVLPYRCLKGGTMLFHAFRVVYTVKELDSHAKYGQSSKTIWTYNRVFLWQKSYFRVRPSFRRVFSILALHDVNKGGTPYMGISPRRTHPCTHRPAREQERAHQHASFGCTARDSLGKECLWRSAFLVVRER